MQTLKSASQYLAFLAAGILLGYLILQAPAWFRPSAIEGDYSAFYAGAPNRVVMYSTQTCPYCAKTRAYFAERRIAYVERDVQSDPAALAQLKQLGGTGVPQVLIGDRRIPGFLPKALDAALERLHARALSR